MTSSVQQHIAIANNGTSKRNRKSYMFSQNIYQVEANGDVGSHRLKLADSCAEATATAESLANDSMINISYISVFVMD